MCHRDPQRTDFGATIILRLGSELEGGQDVPSLKNSNFLCTRKDGVAETLTPSPVAPHPTQPRGGPRTYPEDRSVGGAVVGRDPDQREKREVRVEGGRSDRSGGSGEVEGG